MNNSNSSIQDEFGPVEPEGSKAFKKFFLGAAVLTVIGLIVYTTTNGVGYEDVSKPDLNNIQVATTSAGERGVNSEPEYAATNGNEYNVPRASKISSTTPRAQNGFSGLINKILNTAPIPRKAASFYSLAPVNDGIDNSFYDLTQSKVVTPKGEYIGDITDVLVDKATGHVQHVVFSNINARGDTELFYISYNDILVQERDGDIQARLEDDVFKTKKDFSYSPEILQSFISLKYLKQGQVIDGFDNPVGDIRALVYDNNKIETLYFMLDQNLATGTDRVVQMPFDQSNISLNERGFDLRLTLGQTETLANRVLK